MFTFFTDRDGKYQLASLAESAFDPLARSCQFMLTEEAHHMYVGETGVSRVVQRACEIMCDKKTDDVRHFGGIDLPTLQKYINFHFSVSEDLFGSGQSTNAANYFTSGLKGRYQESRLKDDHQLVDEPYSVIRVDNGKLIEIEVSALSVVNERLRDDYIADCQRGIDRWNKIISDRGIDFSFKLPHRAFHRQIGEFAEIYATPEGRIIDRAEWDKHAAEWLPNDEDQEYVGSLMVQVTEPGEFAPWIAPPRIGINDQPVDFAYVSM